MADWKDYETQILEKFRKDHPDADFTPNTQIPGALSKTSRQIDILIKGDLAGVEVLGVIECKCFNKKVDVKVIDSFIGLLEDVGAGVGIIVTNKGFTKAAKNRAASKRIRIDIVEFVRLELYHFEWDDCEICDSNGYSFREIYWEQKIRSVVYRKRRIAATLGNCSYCDSTHLKCCKCGQIMPIYDGDYGEPQECSCGNIFLVEREYDHNGIDTVSVFLKVLMGKLELQVNYDRNGRGGKGYVSV